MIPTTINKTQYDCNGVQTVFPFAFKIFNETDIVVILRDSVGKETTLEFLSDYDVTAENDDFSDGGNVETFETYDSGNSLTIMRVLELKQETKYKNLEKFPAQTFENDLDKQTCIAQQILEKISRAIQTAVTDEETSLEIPSKLERAGNLFGFDAEGRPMAVTGISGAPTTEFMATLLDDETAAAALTTLGISAFIQTLLDDANAAAALTTLGISAFIQTLLVAVNAGAARTTLDVYSKVEIDGMVYQWIPVADPSQGWLQSVTSWTGTDDFDNHGAIIDFSSVVPTGTIAILCTVGHYSQGGTSMYRGNGDTNISNTPFTDNENSHVLTAESSNADIRKPREIWLGADYKIQVTINHTSIDLHFSPPIAVYVPIGAA